MARNRKGQLKKTAPPKATAKQQLQTIIAPSVDENAVIALRVPSEGEPFSALLNHAESFKVWEKIFKMAREGENYRSSFYSRNPTEHLRICKSLQSPALSAFYENLDIEIASPNRGVSSGFKNFPEKYLHLTKKLKISYYNNLFHIDWVEDMNISFFKQFDLKSASEVAQKILKILRKTPKLTTLSLGFTCLAKISNINLLEIGKAIVGLKNLRDLEVWAPKFDLFVDLITDMRGKAVARLVMQCPTEVVMQPKLAKKLAKGEVMILRSLTIGWPHDNDELFEMSMLMYHLNPEEDLCKEETAITHLFDAFAIKGQLEHFTLADPYKNNPFDRYSAYQRSPPMVSAVFLDHVIKYGSTLKTLAIEVYVTGLPDISTPDFSSLSRLTSLRLVASCDYFFQLEDSALPPNLINFSVENYEGKLKPVMDALANKKWLPKLETFDLTFNDAHDNIEFLMRDGWEEGEEDMHVWLENDLRTREQMPWSVRKKYIAEAGRPLSDFAKKAAALCAARNITHQNADDFFWKFTPPY